MSERGKKVNKHNPAKRVERRTKKAAVVQRKKELISDVTAGIAPRRPIDVPATAIKPGANYTLKVESAADLLTPAQKEAAEKAAKLELKSKMEDVGPTQRGKARRALDKSQAASDEAAIAEAKREKTPSEQAAVDAAALGVSVEELTAVRAGNASFIDQKPKLETNFEPANLAVPDIDQPRGDWSPVTGTGIFTPAPTGAIRGNRAQPTSPAVQENTASRIESGRGLSGMQEGAASELIKHPVYGDMEVPADIARAHRLYDLDWQKNSGRANRLAGLEGSEDYASPYAHKGGHYERLGRLQAAGENPDDISAYARKMKMTDYDVVESRHALLQDKKDSSVMVNYGMQHLNSDDTFTHPETGAEHPMSEWSTVHNMPLTDEGLPNLSATKGTNTSVYKDSRGNLQTTVPTHVGWWKTPTDGQSGRENLGQRPGNWSFRSTPVALDASPSSKPISAYDFTLQQTREALPIGSKQSRAEISEAARAMAQIASASGVSTEGRVSQVQVTDATTGRALEEPITTTTSARPTYKTTDTPAEDPTVYKRSGRGKKVIKDVSHLVSQQMAATVGGGPETGLGEITRSGETATTGGTAPTQGRSRSFVPAPIISNDTDGASAFQPGKTVVAGTAAENKALSETLRTQDENIGKTGGRGFGNTNDAPVEGSPAYSVDVAGNPIPNPPTAGVKGAKRSFIRSRSATGNRVPAALQKFFEPVHAPADGAQGPQVTSGITEKAARRNKRTGEIIDPEVKGSPGSTAYATPLSPTQAPLTQSQQWIQAAMPTGDENYRSSLDESLKSLSGTTDYVSPDGFGQSQKITPTYDSSLPRGSASNKPTMTTAAAQKYSRIYLQDNPKKGPEQPMLDFGQLEREEENSRKEASAANGGVDATTGKKFRRSGQQWGFLDTRWLGDVGTTDENLAKEVSQENRAKGGAYPRAPRPAPGGLPKAGPKSAPVDTNGASPAAIRILGEMYGSKQIQDAMVKLRGAQNTEG